MNATATAKGVIWKLSPFWFFMAFAFGLLACYLLAPKPEVVVKFPSPYNAGKIVYNDKAHNCFVYNAEEVACPKDGHGVRPQPFGDQA